jgi:acyl carrier protein
VEACLRDELIETVKAEAAVRNISLPRTPASIANTPFQIDSLGVVVILCAVESIIGFELPHNVVRAGGYGSVESALEQLLPRIEAEWIKRKGDRP